MGSAMLAAVAANLQPDLIAAAGLVGGIKETITPDAGNKQAHDDAYRRYRKLFDSLRPMFREEW